MHPHMDRLLLCLVQHQPDSLEAEHIRDLVRIDEHAGRAAHTYGTRKLRHGDHARFHMHVSIQQAGDQVAPFGVDDLCLPADRVPGILTDVGNVPILDRDIGARDDLPRLHADPIAVLNHQVSRDTSHGDIDQRTSQFCRGRHKILRRNDNGPAIVSGQDTPVGWR